MRRARSTLLLVVAIALSACAGSGSNQPSGSGSSGLRVVTSSTVFADLVRTVAGDHASVVSLVPAGVDVHTFSPTPAAIRAVSTAHLIVMNGLGLDDWVLSTISAANSSAPVLQLASNVSGFQPLPGEDVETANPHLWLDVSYAEGYVSEIAQALERLDPQHASDYRSSYSDEVAKLDALDGWIRDQFGRVPAEDRQVVTFHDAFPYFARAYGLTIVGVAVEAPGQEPSAGQIGALISAIRSSGVKAVLAENQFPRKLADVLAAESGAVVVYNLYDDSVGDPPVTSYDAVMRWDVSQIVGAL